MQSPDSSNGQAKSSTARPDLLSDVLDLHDRIEQLARGVVAGKARPSPGGSQSLQFRIRRILKWRESRERIFGEPLFADPAWDMLLELYAARLSDRNESVSSICLASRVPSTTALRWIRHLENTGWIDRAQDPHDGRRYFLRLTDKAEAAMERFFAQPEYLAGV
jgi:DNA-binding MarR family transcriptional regulator